MTDLQLADAVAAVQQGTNEVDRIERRPVKRFVDEYNLAFFEMEHYNGFYDKESLTLFPVMAEEHPPSPEQEGVPLHSGDCGSSPQ